ncbi:hypothetical protein KW790_01090 [Candidatus Parcubacteria bacterium]|nr:hypothetical protein [Candidatus Parcubacteria bacterium]
MPRRALEEVLKQSREGPFSQELYDEIQKHMDQDWNEENIEDFTDLQEASAFVANKLSETKTSRRQYIFGAQDEDEDLH